MKLKRKLTINLEPMQIDATLNERISAKWKEELDKPRVDTLPAQLDIEAAWAEAALYENLNAKHDFHDLTDTLK